MGGKVGIPLAGALSKAIDIATDAGKAAAKAAAESATRLIFHSSAHAAVLHNVHESAHEAAKQYAGHGNMEMESALKKAAMAAANAAVEAVLNESSKRTRDASIEAAAEAASDATAISAPREVSIIAKSDMKTFLEQDANRVMSKYPGYSRAHTFMTDISKEVIQLKKELNLPTYKCVEATMCLDSLSNIEKQLSKLSEWINKSKEEVLSQDPLDADDTTALEPLLQPIIAGLGNFRRIAAARSERDDKKITDAGIDSLRRSLLKVTAAFDVLAGYMLGKKSTSRENVQDACPLFLKTKVFHWSTELSN